MLCAQQIGDHVGRPGQDPGPTEHHICSVNEEETTEAKKFEEKKNGN